MAESRSSRGRSRDDAPQESRGEHRFSDEIGTAIVDGLTFTGKAVQYAVIDGMAMVEGDIVLGPVEQVQRQVEERQAIAAGAPIAAAVLISGSQYRWPNCVIPYQIEANFPNPERVTDAVAHWESRTTYRFVQRTPANEAQYPDFVEFVSGNGCSSYVGRQGGRQPITLAAGCTVGNCIHEIGHAVGLWHEQSREDRDNFVSIQWANIVPAAIHNFDQHISDGDDVGPYDYGSIMHYPRNAFSANGQDTIVPVDPNAQIGQRTGLSAGDIAAVNSLCPQGPTPPTLTFPPTRTFPTRTFPTRTLPTRTLPPTRTFPPPTVTFPPPTRTLPPTRTFPPPTRTFPPPTRTFPPPTRTFPPPTRTLPPTRTFPPPLGGPRTFPPPLGGPRTFPPPLLIQPPMAGPGFDPYGYGPYGYDPYAAAGLGGADPYGPAGGTAYAGYDPYAAYDPYAGYDPYAAYDPYAGHDPYGGYDPYAGSDPYGGYDPYAGHDPYGSSGDPYGYGG